MNSCLKSTASPKPPPKKRSSWYMLSMRIQFNIFYGRKQKAFYMFNGTVSPKFQSVCVCVHTCTHMCVTKLWITPSLICGSQVSLGARCVRYLLTPIKSDLAFSLRLLWKDTHLKRPRKQPQLCLRVDLDHSKNTFWKTFETIPLKQKAVT